MSLTVNMIGNQSKYKRQIDSQYWNTSKSPCSIKRLVFQGCNTLENIWIIGSQYSDSLVWRHNYKIEKCDFQWQIMTFQIYFIILILNIKHQRLDKKNPKYDRKFD